MHFKKFRPLVHIPMIIGGITIIFALSLLFGLFVQLLWNWLMPVIFINLPHITYWQAWGLLILCHILFKFGGHPFGHHKTHRHYHDKEWKEKFKERFREKFNTDENNPEKEDK
jgi:hypothetical protein